MSTTLSDLATRTAATLARIERLIRTNEPDAAPPAATDDVWEAGMRNGKAATGTHYLSADGDE